MNKRKKMQDDIIQQMALQLAAIEVMTRTVFDLLSEHPEFKEEIKIRYENNIKAVLDQLTKIDKEEAPLISEVDKIFN
jgi:hypothetical protein